ncbi:hypothetical protein GWI33_009684 [Rhynchophorus ferrugineus]|uniref:Mos1 transposase HTH domain-containing protein n=1 Tax=Rhynchophorus ferrugineus TaxID=354439 RepID=A0A834I988_RHYFE|nr:hypothetical protein GWI33_009684 [Rhynchophorus ferrugineus]
MDKKEFRVLIKYCFLKGKNTVEAKTWLDAEFPDPAPGKSTIKDWYAKFRSGEMSTEKALLDRLKDEIAEQRPYLKKKKVLLHQDNAPCHKSLKTMAKIHELCFELLPHPPYSPDLPPATISCSQVSNECSLERNFPRMKILSSKLRPILKEGTNRTTKIVSIFGGSPFILW